VTCPIYQRPRLLAAVSRFACAALALFACAAPQRAARLAGPYGQPSAPRDSGPRGARVVPKLPPGPSLAGARDALCAVTEGGRAVHCWGVAAHAALRTPSATPRRVAGLPKGARVTQVAVGSTAACALIESGHVVCWGDNSYGELGNPSRQGSARPQYVQGLSRAARVVARGQTFCALSADGAVYCWGKPTPLDGLEGKGAMQEWAFGAANLIKALPRPVLDLSLTDGLASELRGGCVARGAGELWCWGETSMMKDYLDPLGALRGERAWRPPGDGRLARVPTARPVRQVFAGRTTTYFITADGALWCQGGRGAPLACGQLRPYEDLAAREVPDAGPTAACLHAQANGDNACLLTRDGAAKCWGECASGVCVAPKGYRFPPPDLRGYMGAQRNRYAPVTQSILKRCKEACAWGVERLPGHDESSHVFAQQLKCISECDGDHRHIRALEARERAGDVVSPQRVPGPKRRFVSLGRTASEVCGVTAEGEVWCWGGGRAGAPRRVPLR